MNLKEAINELKKMKGKDLQEVANVYLMHILDIDSLEELNSRWIKLFDKPDLVNETAKAIADLSSSQQELDIFLKTTILEVLNENPSTKDFFIEIIESSGEQLVVVEVVTIATAATVLLREYYKKGRKEETIIREYDSDHNLIKETIKTIYEKESKSFNFHFFKKLIGLIRK